MTTAPERIGIFGGTFDPPHIGHLIAAQEIHSALGLDTLLLIPAAVPPHKRGREITAGEIRVEMLRAAVDGDERFEVSDIELRRSGASYTVDTLRALRDEHPDAELFLVLGSDQLAEFDTWREPAEIRRLATVVGYRRAGAVEAPAGFDEIRLPLIELSATEIRRRVRTGDPITYLVPAAVESLIRERRLYV